MREREGEIRESRTRRENGSRREHELMRKLNEKERNRKSER